MIKLSTSYTLTHIPYITDDALDDYAEQVIRDYNPALLVKPSAFNVEHFAEHYLKLSVVYNRVLFEKPILGMTAFGDGKLAVESGIIGVVTLLHVRKGTVIIDPSLLETRNRARRRFTLMHEAAHWLLHQMAFAEDNLFQPGVYENPYMAAKQGCVDYSRSERNNTDHERMERQADFLAAALLMPKTTLRMAFADYFHSQNEPARQVVRGRSEADDKHALALPDYIGARFGVSKRAALIRLEKLNAITKK